MRKSATLPLGIDVGEARVRVALAQRRPDGSAELLAVATRACGSDLGQVLADAIAELRTRERRCVFGVGEPWAVLRRLPFPPMRRTEVERAARLEAGRLVDFPIDEGFVRVEPLDALAGDYAVGVVRRDRIAALRCAARRAKLRIVGIDAAALALQRALPGVDAVLDIGVSRSMLYVFNDGLPRAHRLTIGGAAFTQSIVAAFGTDDMTAERRKLTHGIGGSGEAVRDMLVESIANALIDCRADGLRDVRSVALVGNGSRLADLAAAIEGVTAVRVAIAQLPPAMSPTLPPDVLRAAAPDWCQAYGLALWAAA